MRRGKRPAWAGAMSTFVGRIEMASVTGMRGVLACAVIAAAAYFTAPTSAFAHGGVALEQDECVLRIGPNTMHFIGYQRS